MYVCGCVCLCVCVCVCILQGRLLEHNPLGRQRIMLVDSIKILLKAIVVEDGRYLELKKISLKSWFCYYPRPTFRFYEHIISYLTR